jgi:IS605 OrfB family transposase
MAVRYYEGTFTIKGRRLGLPVAAGAPRLTVRLSREVPYRDAEVRSVTLVSEAGRLCVDVTAEVPLASYRDGEAPDPLRFCGVDLGVIHPFAVAGPEAHGLIVSGRAMRAESRLHLAEQKPRSAAASRRAPRKGERGSRRWAKFAARTRTLEARHRRRLAQARHEAASEVVAFAVERRAGTLVVGDPVGVLSLQADRRHNKRVRDWRPGELKAALADKAEQAGISVVVVDERGTSSTCPECHLRVAKPKGRIFSCPHCGLVGHRDIVGAVNIAARTPGGGSIVSMPKTITHRRGGQHLPGAGRSRRDPRRTRWQVHRARRESWPAVARPGDEDLEGSSSNVVSLTVEDQQPEPEGAKVG